MVLTLSNLTRFSRAAPGAFRLLHCGKRPLPPGTAATPLSVFAVALATSLSGCDMTSVEKKAAEAGATKSGAALLEKNEGTAKVKKEVSNSVRLDEMKGSSERLGPQLILLPGQGVGAIRFGATFATVERHMGAPCDIRTETRCAYIRQAVEFTMNDGVLVSLLAQGRGRVVSGQQEGKDTHYGTFHGVLPPSIQFGLHHHIALKEFGEPTLKKRFEAAGASRLVERDFYDGVTLEFDSLSNGNEILAGIEILASKTAPKVTRERVMILQKDTPKGRNVPK